MRIIRDAIFARERSLPFDHTRLELLKQFYTEGAVGNRWYKVNLHVHGKGNDPTAVVAVARQATIDILAITDHQTFDHYDGISAAAQSPGRPLTVLPGIEVTTHEGLHLLAIFSPRFSKKQREQLIGWLEIPGTGNTRIASAKTVDEVLPHVEQEGGIVVVPHPWTPKIGLLGGSPKVETRVRWFETGHIKLMQVPEDKRDEKIRYVGHDSTGRWVNRYVLRTANDQQIAESTYCLAPFNRSDAKHPDLIPDGCSWFRMEFPSVDGLRQVACEPRTRISIREPVPVRHDCFLAVRVRGGYCDGQTFWFNESLNCIVGDNHAGKSAVFDLIRFVLGHAASSSDNQSRWKLLRRLYSILQPDGMVELFLRYQDELYVIERTFRPETKGSGESLEVVGCQDRGIAYQYESTTEQLIPVDDFQFPLEIYEQGRIGQLRDDVARQLEMLDEFADVSALKSERDSVWTKLTESADTLKPLYEEREELQSDVSQLSKLEEELKQYEDQLPDEEVETGWANATAVADGITRAVDSVTAAAAHIPDPGDSDTLRDLDDPLVQLFTQSIPEIPTDIAEGEWLGEWRRDVQHELDEIESARVALAKAAERLVVVDRSFRKEWKRKHEAYEQQVSDRLAKIGVESPKQLRRQVNSLRSAVRRIKTETRPRLTKFNEEIARLENDRQNLRTQLQGLNETITTARRGKAVELTESLEGRIIVSVTQTGDRSQLLSVLRDICVETASQQHRIQSREQQLQRIVESVGPLELADALRDSGRICRDDAQTTLTELCGVTENTQNVLCAIANDILLLNRIETTDVPDVPKIKVRREGEQNSYAELATGLSPGEQSAAILTLALQTRSRPLILDQPEDELGYAYVVNLIVPKVLEAKFLRQLLVVTHVANIPVLADADYVTKMENQPSPTTGRQCVVAAEGCFERPEVTKAVLQLEGGEQAFRFRQHRYSLATWSNYAGAPARQPPRAPLRLEANRSFRRDRRPTDSG